MRRHSNANITRAAQYKSPSYSNINSRSGFSYLSKLSFFPGINTKSIKPVDKSELETIFNWVKEEGWNPGMSDLESYHTIDPDGFNMLWVNNKPVSALASVRYRHSYAFLGLYIVKPEYRGYGYGKLLWGHAMKLVSSYQSVGLNAVLDQIPNYEKSGFSVSNYNTRWQAEIKLFNPNLKKESEQKKYQLSKNIAVEEIAKMDCRATACYRPNFWKSALVAPYSYFLGAKHEGRLIGFALISKCVDGYKFGPLYAENTDIAEDLLKALWSRALQETCKIDDKIQLDTSATNEQAVLLAKKYDFTKVYDTARMYKGRKPEMDDIIIYGLPSLEIG